MWIDIQQEFKDWAVAGLLPTESAATTIVSQEHGVPMVTLERWRAEARLQAVIGTANAWCRE
jgi:transposase-like protein